MHHGEVCWIAKEEEHKYEEEAQVRQGRKWIKTKVRNRIWILNWQEQELEQ